jgi:hypothetical protein
VFSGSVFRKEPLHGFCSPSFDLKALDGLNAAYPPYREIKHFLSGRKIAI